ncbi:MAG: peptide deformylase [Thermonemataceae bacterium]|nr:peptide deformylase [Thermonemataceae bacterium]
MILPIVAYGDPVLKQVAQEIEIGTSLDSLIADMYETMYEARGIGLAAPQIGKSIRLFIVDGTLLEDEEDASLKDFKKVFVNPLILEESGEKWAMEEGCLSIPGIREDVSRKESLKIRYYDAQWNLKEENYTDMAARIIQHEYDHIEGKLFVDYLSSLKKRLLKGKLSNISKGICDADYKMRFPLAKAR